MLTHIALLALELAELQRVRYAKVPQSVGMSRAGRELNRAKRRMWLCRGCGAALGSGFLPYAVRNRISEFGVTDKTPSHSHLSQFLFASRPTCHTTPHINHIDGLAGIVNKVAEGVHSVVESPRPAETCWWMSRSLTSGETPPTRGQQLRSRSRRSGTLLFLFSFVAYTKTGKLLKGPEASKHK